MNARHVLPAASLVILALGSGCGMEKSAARAEAPAVAGAQARTAAPAAAAGAAADLTPASRALRVTVDTSIVVADVEASVARVRQMTEASGGYVGEAHVSSTGASLELHVPAATSSGFRAELAEIGDVMSEGEKVDDVTEQRADIDARVRNARAQEKRLLSLLSDKTGSLADVVAVEKELANVRESIERVEAQQRVLEGQIALATIKVQLSTKYVPTEVGTIARLGQAGSDGIHAAGAFVVGVVVVTMTAGPTALLAAGLVYAMYRMGRRFFPRRASPLRA